MSTAQGNELGTLIVVVLKARNLKDDHSFYKQDVFAQASLNGMDPSAFFRLLLIMRLWL